MDYSGDFNRCEFAGRHLIAELWGVDPDILKNESKVQNILEDSARDAKATVLCSKFHHFGEEYGVTGVIILAESHISIHTWPEHGYAAIDIFMCGECDPREALPRIRREFKPDTVETNQLLRGVKWRRI